MFISSRTVIFHKEQETFRYKTVQKSITSKKSTLPKSSSDAPEITLNTTVLPEAKLNDYYNSFQNLK